VGAHAVAPRECLLQQAVGDAEIDRIRGQHQSVPVAFPLAKRLHLPNVALREPQLDPRATSV